MFLTVKFNPADARTYTYRYDGAEEITPGDFVVVEVTDGRKAVEVVDVDVPAPSFRCKPIAAVLIEKDA